METVTSVLPLEVEELIKFQNAYITFLHKRIETLEVYAKAMKSVDSIKTRKINNLRLNLAGTEATIRKYKKSIKLNTLA